MASVIKAGNATDGVQVTSDNTGILELKTGTGSGTVALTLGTDQSVTFAGTITAASGITGDFKMNSGYGSVATAYGCRAWVNFNGTGTVAIRASGNVTSITDNGTGDYTVNFTTAMPDANYAVQGLAGLATAVGPMYVQSPSQTTDFTQTTSAFRFGTASAHANAVVSVYRDTALIFLAIFR